MLSYQITATSITAGHDIVDFNIHVCRPAVVTECRSIWVPKVRLQRAWQKKNPVLPDTAISLPPTTCTSFQNTAMATEATPRINARYLEQFTNSTVRILGRVTALRGDSATVDANGSIQVQLNRDAHLTLNNAVEIIGKVQPDLSVKVFQAMDFGSNIDFKAVEAVVDATHRYKEIFYNAD